MKILIISCSLHPRSRSRLLANHFIDDVQALGADIELIDLRDLDIPFCDAVSSSKAPDARLVTDAIREASAVILAVPIYNFDVNAAAKNLLENTMRVWTEKLVGFICVAGGRSSYMSVMGLANDLMLDFRCLIIPRFVYATGDDFTGERSDDMALTSDTVRERLAELASTTVALAGALEGVYGGS